ISQPPPSRQLAQRGPAGLPSSSIASAEQHIVQAPQTFPGAAVIRSSPSLPLGPNASGHCPPIINRGRRDRGGGTAAGMGGRPGAGHGRAGQNIGLIAGDSLDSTGEPVSFRALQARSLMKTAVVFPGQGSQTVGMGKALAQDFAVAREVFERVDEALSQKLSQLMFGGPEQELTLTVNAQPALMASSIAALRVLESEAGFQIGRDAAFVAGHSLGEYSALCAAGSITLQDTARLLRLRGEAMQNAVPVGEGAMAAILGLEFGVATRIATDAASDFYLTGAVCQAANDNGGGQVVISGTRAAVERAMDLAKLAGAKRAIFLPVSAPFHCGLMQPAALAMEAALNKVAILRPKPPLVANVTASMVDDPGNIRSGLVAQATGTVRWRESIAYMSGQGVTRFIEVGTGKVLAGLIKRIVGGATAISVGTPADIDGFKALAAHA